MSTILIVDDHRVNREFLATLLGYAKHRLLQASDGAEALEIVRIEHPDLVISDILMPTMDGYEFVRQLRADPKMATTAVIFYTAHYHKQEAQQLARTCGVARILTKPCEPEIILRTVEEALKNPLQIITSLRSENFDHEHLRVITDKLSQTTEELGDANQRLSALIEISLQLASERAPRQLLKNVCRSARDLLGAKYAVLAVGSKDNGSDVYFVTSGMDTATEENMGPPNLREGLVGSAFIERRSFRLTNVKGDPQVVGLPPSHPSAHSLLVAPIVSLAHIYGWICLTDKVGAEEFSAEDERLLTILAAQVGRVYENGSLYTEIREHATQLEAQVAERKLAEEKIKRLNRVYAVLSGINTLIVRVRDRQALFDEACRIAVEHGEFGIAWIGMINTETKYVDPVAWYGSDAESVVMSSNTSPPNTPMRRGVVSSVFKEKRSIFDNDIAAGPEIGGKRRIEAIRRGYRSMIVLPLFLSGVVVGTLSLLAKERDFFTGEEVKLLDELAGDISFALEHIAKEEKIARMSRIQSVMSNINALIVHAENREALFEGTCRIAIEHGKFGTAWIGTFDPETSEVFPVAWAGINAERLALTRTSEHTNVAHGNGVVARAIREKQPVFENDLAADPLVRSARRAEAVRDGLHSLIALPFIVEGSVVAHLSLYGREANFFDDNEVRLLTELASDISFALEHIAKKEKLDYLAYYDAMTGLPNRTLLRDYLGRVVRRAIEEKSKSAVVICDINRFSHVNETLGREAGDALLREVGLRLKEIWPEPDNLARLSADCFGGIIANIKDASEIAHLIAKPLADVLNQPFAVGGEKLRISMTTGVAVFPSDGDDADALLKNAEAALKKAKGSGETYLFYHSKMNAAVTETLRLENKLRGAIENEQFVLHYQPKLNLVTGHLSGLEALIRWKDPENGLIPPVKFIPLLEETGMIIEVGAWAIRKALTDHHAWQVQGLQPPRIAVNVSATQLRQKDFVERVRNKIRNSKSAPHGLDLEITESLIMDDIEGNIEKLKALRDMKINIAIDDFGTGYSSLGYLARLPVNLLKIDRSFIITMTKDADSMAIVSTIISLAHSLDMKVIAEGVETEEQSRFLKLLKCDEMQGYLFSKPLPADQLTKILEDRREM